MSGQLESKHFFRTGDLVRGPNGTMGKVIEGLSLYAIVQWMNGECEERDQFDPWVEVVERAAQD